MPEMPNITDADFIIDRHIGEPDALYAILQDIQAQYRCLPNELLRRVADRLKYTDAQVHQAVAYDPAFTSTPRGKYTICVCDGTACHFNHQPDLLPVLWKTLGLNHQQGTTSDGMFTVETCSCLGVCGLGSAVMINDQVYPAMTPQKLLTLLATLRNQ